MKVFDRYEGLEVDLPDDVEPGRFRLLRPAVLNGCVAIAKGGVLWSDGSRRCVLTGDGQPAQRPRVFAQPPLEQDPERPDGVIDHALRGLVQQMDVAQDDALPSPVMPAQLDDMAETHALECLLRKTIDAGHLDQIARRPRMDMRYEKEVLPVSRARRMAPDMLTRLASHSEDWHRRDITGVVPSRLKAEVSEDELAIYENVVFVRLLERLLKWLDRRVKDLKSLEASHEIAKGIQEADRLDYRLRDALCALWGRSFEDQQNASQLVTKTRKELQSLLGRVRQLLSSEVAKSVPPARQIPLALRDTNILRHDRHYSHLRPLWLSVHDTDQAGGRSPEERFEQELKRGERHVRYVELLLRHALKAIRLLEPKGGAAWDFGPWRLTLKRNDDEWVLALDTYETPMPAMRFVPGMRGHRDWSRQRSDRLVVFCMPEKRRESGDQCGGDSVLNAMEFYGVERVRCAVEAWLLSQLAMRWPFKVVPAPTALVRAMVEAGGGRVVGYARGLQVLGSVGNSTLETLDSAAQASLDSSPDARAAIIRALKLAELVSTCRQCQSQVDDRDFQFSSSGFKATCRCRHEWTFSRQNPTSCEARYGISDSSRPFEEIGSLKLSLSSLTT